MKVWLKRSADKDVEKLWHVVEVGLPNEHGYDLDIKIKNPFGEEMKVSGVSSWTWDSYPKVAIFPKKQPKLLSSKKRLKAILDGHSEHFLIICEDCLSPIIIKLLMEEVSNLRLADDSESGRGEFFTESQPEVDNSGRSFRCECPKNMDLDDFEEIEFESYT
jgi:hypothetical protein